MVWLGLGSNEGDRRENLSVAIARIAGLVEIEAISPVYESEPVGYRDQPDFWNLVIRVRTALSPADLLRAMKRIETDLGRAPAIRWGPRPIDVDILAWSDRRISEPGLEVPHPRMLERGFVLRPLADVDPDFRHPVTGMRVEELLARGGFETSRRLFQGTDLLPRSR